LYRYFPTKDDLIERVYKEVYVNQMDPDWSLKLQDRSVPLEQRLIDYYKSYAKVVHRYEWIRIYFFSGLKGNPLNRRYIRVVQEKILKPIGAEIRETCDLPSVKEVPLTPIELERIWVMHGGLFYYAVRKNIYHSNVFDDFEAIVTSTVKVMLEGAKTFSIEELH